MQKNPTNDLTYFQKVKVSPNTVVYLQHFTTINHRRRPFSKRDSESRRDRARCYYTSVDFSGEGVVVVVVCEGLVFRHLPRHLDSGGSSTAAHAGEMRMDRVGGDLAEWGLGLRYRPEGPGAGSTVQLLGEFGQQALELPRFLDIVELHGLVSLGRGDVGRDGGRFGRRGRVRAPVS